MRNYKKKAADYEKKYEPKRPVKSDDEKPERKARPVSEPKKGPKKYNTEPPKKFLKPWERPPRTGKPFDGDKKREFTKDRTPKDNTDEKIEANDNYIYGRNAVMEALRADSSIEKIYLQFGAQGDSIGGILSMARKAKITIAEYDKGKFQRFAKDIGASEAKTQGVIALKAQIETLDLGDLIDKALEKSDNPILLILDEISDPHNLGAIARSAECAGAAGLILPMRNAAPITPVAVKTSAGALERISVAKVNSVVTAIEKLKDKGFWVIGAAMGDESLYDLSAKLAASPLALVIGAEGSGIRPAVLKKCDKILSIPLKGEISSLNASVAAGVFLFELCRSRGDFGGAEDSDDIEYFETEE